MEVSVIGSGSVGWNRVSACACFLVSVDGQRILLDVGPGAILSSISFKWGLDIRDVDVIVLSHFDHLDHVGDFPSLLFSMNNLAGPSKFYPRTKRLKVFGPMGTEKFVERLLGVFSYCRPKAMELIAVGLEPPKTVRIRDDILLRVEEAQHRVPSVCTRIEYLGKTVAYSGANGPLT
jgi:ribonuclease BN (tRNA processing enzyme)